MMDSRFRRITSGMALFLGLALGQMYLPVSLAESAGNAGPSASSAQQATAILTTASNRPISVNGVNAVSGATIMTGAAIETPDQVGASMSLPGAFTLDIAPNAKLNVTFDRNSIKVNLIKGCVVLHVKQGTTGEIITSRGSEKADGTKDDRLDVCDREIPPAAGLSSGAKIGIVVAIGGLLALIPIFMGGDNPSPNSPS